MDRPDPSPEERERIEGVAREIIKKELTLDVEKYTDDDGVCFTVGLRLDGERIGKTVNVTVTQLMSRTEVGIVTT